MEEIKFYNVKVGTTTRAGNMNVIHSFICQTKSNIDYNSIYAFYNSRYKGFAIQAELITEIVQDEIPKVEPYSYETSDSKKIKELEKEINDLKQSRSKSNFGRFSGTISSRHPEIRSLFEELEQINQEYRLKKEELIEAVKPIIGKRYNKDVDVYQVSIGTFTHKDSSIPFTVILIGEILPENNIITDEEQD